MSRANTGKRRAAAICVAAAVVTALFLLSQREKQRIAPAVAAEPAPAAPAEVAEPSPLVRVRADPDVLHTCRVTVREESGAALGQVVAYPWPAVAMPPTMDAKGLAVSGADGVLELALPEQSAILAVCLWKAGFAPVQLTGLQLGGNREVVMRRGGGVRLFFQYADGAPCAGLRAALAMASPAALPVEPAADSGLLFQPRERGDNAFVGSSDAAGAICVDGLVPGRYFLRCNLDLLPVHVVHPPVLVEVPGPDVAIEVQDYGAVVVEFVGDEVLGSARPIQLSHHAFRVPDSIEPQHRTTADLQRRFPRATVLVGLPSQRWHAGLMGTFRFFGRTSGWSTHELAIRPVTEIHEPTVVELHGSAEQSALVRVVAIDGNGAPLPLPGASAGFTFEDGGWFFRARVPFGQPTRLPALDYTVYPIDELQEDAFAMRRGALLPGTEQDLAVQVAAVHRYRVAIEPIGGRVPQQWAFSLESATFNLHGTCTGPDYSFYTTADTVHCSVFQQGYRAATIVMRRGEGTVLADGTECFRVAFGEVQPGR